MKYQQYIRDSIFIFFVIYYAQGSLYAQGSIIAKISLLLIIFLSFYYFFKTIILKNKKNLFYKTFTTLLLLNIFGFIFTANYGNNLHTEMMKSILVASLPFYPFYYFALIGILKSKHLLRFFIVILPIIILQYFFNANQILANRITNNTDLVNNTSYLFVGLIPFVFLFKKKKIYAIVSMMVIILFIIQGAKRGALIAGAIGLIFFLYYQLISVEKKNRIRGYTVVILMIFTLGYYAYNTFQNNEFLLARMNTIGEEGGSSERDVIYSNIFNAWNNSESIFNLIFGYGFAASLQLSGMTSYAHNDWLELISNFGIIGILIYLTVFYSAMKFPINKKWSIDKRLLLLTIISIWFFITLVSMSYTSIITFVQSIFFAYLFGNKDRFLK